MPDPNAQLSVSEATSHFSVTPQAVRKWCEEGKIAFERAPGGGYRIPAAQFDLARGQSTAAARREIAERLLAKHGNEPTPSDEEMVAAMRKARRDA